MLSMANFSDVQNLYSSHRFSTQGCSFRPSLACKELALSDVCCLCVFFPSETLNEKK